MLIWDSSLSLCPAATVLILSSKISTLEDLGEGRGKSPPGQVVCRALCAHASSSSSTLSLLPSTQDRILRAKLSTQPLRHIPWAVLTTSLQAVQWRRLECASHPHMLPPHCIPPACQPWSVQNTFTTVFAEVSQSESFFVLPENGIFYSRTADLTG